MTFLAHHSMTNHHDGVFGKLAETVQMWRDRQHSRQELAQLSELELHDFGLSISDAAYEADKPFWQA